MKRFINLIESIRSLSEIDIERLKQEEFEDLWTLKELEDIFGEFYEVGFECGQTYNLDEKIDFQNRLSNFYSHDRP